MIAVPAGHRPRQLRRAWIRPRAWRWFLAIVVTGLAGLAGARPAAAEPVDVWLDVDPGTGLSDVDDGLMLVQCFHSPEMRVHGVSVVYGNAPLPHGLKVAQEVCRRFGPRGMVPVPGAAKAEELGQASPAVAKLARALAQRRLTILAVGPVTNVATFIQRYPELVAHIERVVVVAGRRPGQRFISSETQTRPHRDFNFELDPAAMRILLEAPIELIFAPWEVSSHVWITRDDLARLADSGGSGSWIAETSGYWIRLWEMNISPRGFNPFDTLAAGWVTHPDLIEHEVLRARIEQAPDDRATDQEREAGKTKPYLVAEAGPAGRPVIYCYRPREPFKGVLLERLAGTASDRPADAPE